MWVEAIVMPREKPAEVRPAPRGASRRTSPAAPVESRAVIHQRAGEESRQFRDQVLGFLRAHQLMSAVRWVSEPGVFPLVTLHCTRGVLEQLRREPGFEAGQSMSLELTT
ncbi:hypothetical protein LXT21_26360 [Myxococcus sp. K38C18041901]|uniref:hypothetical protein n=1 Tax=Myxococcus guangdongensis TaxID=2906760 RepID=UPI0020A7111B|nr:hypothetical protein [Myxococcus guangdongensis]MCP3062319.1 hypothetical protein [Myxococcus guangdongensis]